MSIKTGVIVLAHGSKVRTGNEGLYTIVEMLRAMEKWDMVEAGFLQLAKPGLTEVVENLIGRGANRVVVMPLLLFSGNHVLKDIPENGIGTILIQVILKSIRIMGPVFECRVAARGSIQLRTAVARPATTAARVSATTISVFVAPGFSSVCFYSFTLFCRRRRPRKNF